MNRRTLDDKVRRILTDWLGNVRIDKDGDYGVPVGSTVGFVKIIGGEEDDSGPLFIEVFAPVGLEVPASDELYRWVALEGGRYKFGSVALWPSEEAGKHTAMFSYSILGDYLDPEELKNALGSVVSTADQLDDEFVARFGGHTMRSE